MLQTIRDLSPGEQRLARLIDTNGPGVWDWDVATNEFLATRRYREILGFGNSDVFDLRALIAATHPDDRAWADILEEAPDTTLSAPVLVRYRIHKSDTGEMRWIASRIWCNRETRGGVAAIAGYSATVEDITDGVETAHALAESEERLRLAIEAGKMAVWEVDLESGALTPSPELNFLCGFEADAQPHIRDVRALYDPGELERLAHEGSTVEAVRDRAVGGAFEPWRRGTAHGGADRTQIQAEVAITTPAGVPKRLLLRAQYAPSPEGRPRLTGLLVDITETKMAEERLAVVARELQHRVKNSLSVIQAIAVQSLRGKADPDQALQAFLGRLRALTTATDLILERSASTRDLRTIIENITRPYRDDAADPFILEGPSIVLPSTATTAMGMILHELCTNAVKHGALSVPEGRVVIRWRRTEEEETLAMSWEEQNGPPVTAPHRRGFGTRLLENVLSGELHGSVALDFHQDGLRCVIALGLTG